MVKKRVWSILSFAAILMMCGCGAGARVEVIDSMEVEAGTELSRDITDYAKLSDNASMEGASLNLEKVDVHKIGTYSASVTYADTDYEFEVHVVDTTAPGAELKEAYTLTQPGTLTASDYIENIEDVTETSVGFLKFSKTEDLRVMTDEELASEAQASSEELAFEEGMDFSETTEASEDGIYSSRIAVKDEAGNMKVFAYTFYVDGTAPVIGGLEDTQVTADADGNFEFDFSRISVKDDLDGDMTERVNDAEEASLVYNNDSDGKRESYTVQIKTSDRAGNVVDKSAIYTVMMPSAGQSSVAETVSQPTEETAAADTPASTPASTGNGSSKDAQARAVAQMIADQCTDGTDLERVTKAAQIVAGYCAAATYTTEDPDYRTAYGVFCKGVYTCAGSTRALGMVLECMGFSWSHANANQWTHQWCIVTLDGQTGYADGMAGLAGYGEFPYL